MGMKVFASARNFVAATASDTTAVSCKAIYVGTTGNITLSAGDGTTTVLFTGVPGGSFLPIELQSGRIMATGTSAGALVTLNW
jgi:hypothetical protein